MLRRTRALLRQIVRALLYGAVGAMLIAIVAFALYLRSWPEVELWHVADLDEEFTADSDVSTLAAYRALEDRLLAQLDEEVISRVPVGPAQQINRFSRGSLSDPGRWPGEWNRTFELSSEAPRAGVLLLHGMSDSPYSLRALGQRLHAAGAEVVGLRMPGHGTAPSGLVTARWQDMAAATALGVRHLHASVGGAPVYVVGYSNGGALAVHYALSSLEDTTTLPPVAGLVLVSPSIGVTGLAAFAVWQARLGHWLGLEKLAWTSVLPEYDPFKYGSFAVNAGDQVYRLTGEIQRGMQRLRKSGALAALPPTLAFQSAVDATVSARALVEGLFLELPPGDHELVLFDLNRLADVESLLRRDPRDTFVPMLSGRDLGFTLSVVTNASDESADVVLHRRRPGGKEAVRTPLGLAWPSDVYSLAHVALPFPPEDPVYGASDRPGQQGIEIGAWALRGERGVIRIPAAELLRLRWNPFFAYLEERVLAFTGLPAPTDPRDEASPAP